MLTAIIILISSYFLSLFNTYLFTEILYNIRKIYFFIIVSLFNMIIYIFLCYIDSIITNLYERFCYYSIIILGFGFGTVFDKILWRTMMLWLSIFIAIHTRAFIDKIILNNIINFDVNNVLVLIKF